LRCLKLFHFSPVSVLFPTTLPVLTVLLSCFTSLHSQSLFVVYYICAHCGPLVLHILMPISWRISSGMLVPHPGWIGHWTGYFQNNYELAELN
jgi:hypothetical protein